MVVKDDSPGHTGTLDYWSLDITVDTAVPTPTPVPSATPTPTPTPAPTPTGPQLPLPLSETCSDNFDDNSLDSSRWNPDVSPPGGSLAETNGRIELNPKTGPTSVGLSTKCSANGDFDAQIDYELVDWYQGSPALIRLVAHWLESGPSGHTGVYTAGWYTQLRSLDGTVVEIYPSIPSGTLRLVRTNTTVWGYYHDGTNFQLIGSAPIENDPTAFLFDTSSAEADPGFTIIVDNFRMSADTVTCP